MLDREPSRCRPECLFDALEPGSWCGCSRAWSRVPRATTLRLLCPGLSALRVDAAEQTDLFLEESEIAAQLGAALDAELAEMERGPRGAKTELDDQMRTLLKAIGYLE